MTPSPEAETPRCALHPTREALETCARCGNFLCAACLSADAGRMVCTNCVGRSAGGGATRRAVTASLLSAGALLLSVGTALAGVPLGCLTFPLSMLGMGMGVVELRAIAAGHSPEAGRRFAKLGLWLGLLAIAAGIATSVTAG